MNEEKRKTKVRKRKIKNEKLKKNVICSNIEKLKMKTKTYKQKT